MTPVERPWGSYEVLHEEPGLKVKKITIDPGKRMSLQLHARRSEQWSFISGRGFASIGKYPHHVMAGDCLQVPSMARHRVQNIGDSPLVFVEVQTGDYLGEDDIVRFEDDFGRV